MYKAKGVKRLLVFKNTIQHVAAGYCFSELRSEGMPNPVQSRCSVYRLVQSRCSLLKLVTELYIIYVRTEEIIWKGSLFLLGIFVGCTVT